jgi:hypothetical protein
MEEQRRLSLKLPTGGQERRPDRGLYGVVRDRLPEFVEACAVPFNKAA